MNLSMPVGHRPRRMPPSTWLCALLGGPLALFGWIFSAFGLVFVVLFLPAGDFSSWLYFHGSLDRAEATITEIKKTRATEGKGRRGTPIYQYKYSFATAGKSYTGSSFQTGESGQKIGDHTNVEFPAGHPEISRIPGMRRNVFGPFVILVIIFPLFGLAVLVPMLWAGVQNVRLLRRGEIAQAKLRTKEATNTSVNKKTVYKLTFEFTDILGERRQAVAKTHEPERLEDDRLETVFYDSHNPKLAVLMDNVTGNVQMNETGDFRPAGFRSTLSAVFPVMIAGLIALAGYLIIHG